MVFGLSAGPEHASFGGLVRELGTENTSGAQLVEIGQVDVGQGEEVGLRALDLRAPSKGTARSHPIIVKTRQALPLLIDPPRGRPRRAARHPRRDPDPRVLVAILLPALPSAADAAAQASYALREATPSPHFDRTP
ncbi:hypothetical protein [Streptomyces sp. cmx-10-25]|uniref:hypothetical protein n=1 Tax=Streptomyces sp. cmx-10-25 TaxID=2790919 RepID=UPI00397FBD3F